jgi:hypothetical protein
MTVEDFYNLLVKYRGNLSLATSNEMHAAGRNDKGDPEMAGVTMFRGSAGEIPGDQDPVAMRMVAEEYY